MSSLVRVRNNGILFQSNFCNIIQFFAWDSDALRIIRVSVTAGCPQGESLLYLDRYPLWMFYTAKTISFILACQALHQKDIIFCG